MIRIQAFKDIALAVFSFSLTVFSVEWGVLASLLLSIVFVLKHSTYPRFSLLGQVPGHPHKFKPLSEGAKKIDTVLMISLHEPLFFGNTGALKDRLRRLEVMGDLDLHPSEPSRQSKDKEITLRLFKCQSTQ